MPDLRLAAILVASLALVPVASAAEASGELTVGGRILLPGESSFVASNADAFWSATGIPALVLTGSGVEVRRTGVAMERTETPAGNVRGDTIGIDERASHGKAALALRPGSESQLVVVRGATVAAEMTSASVRAAHAVPLADHHGLASCETNVAGCYEARGVYDISSEATEGEIQGELTLILRGPVLVLTEGGERTEYASGVTETPTATGVRREETWLIVTVTGGEGTLAGDGLRWLAPRPEITATEARLESATGEVALAGRTYRAASDVVEAKGAIDISPLAFEGRRATDGWAEPGTATYAPSFRAQLAGDVQSINLRAVPVYQEKPAETAAAFAGGVALLAALAWLWPAVKFHATALALPLYTRLQKPDILGNDVRNRIYEIIRANPGISARAVHRLSDQSWGTVVYHLRQLERHHVVVSRSVGRTRNYYENHGKYKGMEVQLACLQSERSRALAKLIATTPGITQEDLVGASGMPQPTTSYYVRKLKRAGLVEETRDGRYVKYQPHADLPRFLEMAAHAAPAPAGDAGPAQA